MKAAAKEELSLPTLIEKLQTLNAEIGLLLKNEYSTVAFRNFQNHVRWLINIQSKLSEEKFSTGFNDE